MKLNDWRTAGLVVGGAAVIIVVVVLTAALGCSWPLRSQLDAGTGLVVLLGLLFFGGPERYVATAAIAGPPAYAVGDRITATASAALSPADQANVARRRALLWRSLYVGLDGRWSTSKFQSLVWTIVFAYTLLTLFIAGRYGQKFGDGGTDTFGTLDFPTNYLLLLGGPYGASLGAKAITSSQSAQKTADTTDPASKSVAEGVQELVGSDDGTTDLGDFQYLLFNIVALVVFLVTFVPDVQDGLPQLPDYLVALTSASALAYLGKKAFGAQAGAITSVLPGRVRRGGVVTITGTALTAGAKVPIVAIDGVASPQVAITAGAASATDALTVTAQVPDGVTAGPGKVVAVQATADVAAVTGTVEIVEDPPIAITSVTPDPLGTAPGSAVTIAGTGFGPAPGAADGARVDVGGALLTWTAWSDTTIMAALPVDPAEQAKLQALPRAPTAVPLTVARAGRPAGAVAVRV